MRAPPAPEGGGPEAGGAGAPSGAGSSAGPPHLHLEFELDAGFGLGPLAHEVQDLEHVRRRRLPLVHHEVRVTGGDLGAAAAEALEPEVVDELPRVAARGVLEDAPGVPALGLAPHALELELPRLLG